MGYPKETAKDKKSAVDLMVANSPKITNAEIKAKLLEMGFKTGISPSDVRVIRQKYGISKKQLGEKSKKLGRPSRRPAITPEDVIILQKSNDIPKDVMDVIKYTIEYMQEIGIQSMELHDDGTVRLTMLKELETKV